MGLPLPPSSLSNRCFSKALKQLVVAFRPATRGDLEAVVRNGDRRPQQLIMFANYDNRNYVVKEQILIDWILFLTEYRICSLRIGLKLMKHLVGCSLPVLISKQVPTDLLCYTN
jgi:hypothetical protein